MPSLEEILANADFGDEAGEQDTAEPTKGTEEKVNSTMKQVRDHARKLERDLKKLQSERDELQKFREETTLRMRQDALTSAGLSPRQTEAYMRLYDDVTPDSVAEFKAEVLGIGEAPEPKETFTPTGATGESTKKMYSRQEFEALMKSQNPADRVRADNIMANNLVEWERDMSHPLPGR